MTGADGYRKRWASGRGVPRGPLGLVDRDGVAIGFCPHCEANARRTTPARGVFNCPECTYQWYDDRVGKQQRSFDEFFSHS